MEKRKTGCDCCSRLLVCWWVPEADDAICDDEGDDAICDDEGDDAIGDDEGDDAIGVLDGKA